MMPHTNRWLGGALAVLLCASLAACQRSPRETEPQADATAAPGSAPRSDAEISTSVQAAYYSDDLVRGRQIDVTTENGVVTLRGTVRDDEARKRAVTVAERVEGVQRVDDQLLVQASETAEARGGDRPTGPATRETEAAGTAGTVGDRVEAGWITTKINAQYFTSRDVSPFGIDVTTSSTGVVTLSGDVDTSHQKAEAVRIARETEGVTQVEDQLRVKAESGTAAARADEPDVERPDAWLTTKVQSKYFLDPDVKGRNIDVDTSEGVVTLTGTVGTDAERRQAVALARTTDGVRDVTDRLQVRADAPAPDRDDPMPPVRSLDDAARDSRITTTIQSTYFLDQQIKGHDIEVDTRNGIVTLRGQVPSEQLKQEAERIASEASGVTRVNNQITVGTT